MMWIFGGMDNFGGWRGSVAASIGAGGSVSMLRTVSASRACCMLWGAERAEDRQTVTGEGDREDEKKAYARCHMTLVRKPFGI